MKKQIGVWIDRRQAVVVTLVNGAEKTAQLKSGLEKHVREPSVHARSTDCGPEDRRERQYAGRLQRYYDKVSALIEGADSILIIGPGQAKTELRNRLAGKHLAGRKIVLQTSDKISERQIAATIRRHFHG